MAIDKLRQNNTIDLLRFLASLFVCLFHFNEGIAYLDNDYRNLVKLGWIGVPIFFVISGYCIQMAAKDNSSINFVIRRFFRIYPMYWFSLFIIFAIAIFQKVYTGNNSIQHLPHNLFEILSTIFLNIDPINHIPSINWVYWSLVCEILFYILFTISLTFKNSLREIFLIILCIVSLVIVPQQGNILYVFKHWPSFALGVGIYLLFHKKNKFKQALVIILVAVSGVVKQNFFEPNGHIYLAGILMTAFAIGVSEWTDIPTNKLSKLGRYAYSIYLLHVPIGVFFLSSIFKFSKIGQGVNIIVDVSIYLFISIIAICTYNFIELPAISLGKKFGKKIELWYSR